MKDKKKVLEANSPQTIIELLRIQITFSPKTVYVYDFIYIKYKNMENSIYDIGNRILYRQRLLKERIFYQQPQI